MSLKAGTLARALRTASDETGRLRTFFDDLDGQNGRDCDTGSNAELTLATMAEAVEDLNSDESFLAAVESAVSAGIIRGAGNIAQLLTIILATWADAVDPVSDLSPLMVRNMLLTDPVRYPKAFNTWHPAIVYSMENARQAVGGHDMLIPEITELVKNYALDFELALVDHLMDNGTPLDPGAVVLSLFYICLDASVRDDHTLIENFATVLKELVETETMPSPHIRIPETSRAFTLDILIEGSSHDAEAVSTHMVRLGAQHSYVGRTDLFGFGQWRFHVDTSAPLAVYPRSANVKSFRVTDNRPDDLIGVDTLVDSFTEGFTHRGIRLLERKPLQRVERAQVVALTQAPGMVEYLAQAGAVVLLNPTGIDIDTLVMCARASSTGVCLVAPCHEAALTIARAAQQRLDAEQEAPRILIAPTHNDLDVLSIAAACATIFVPQPGGREVAKTMEQLLLSTSKATLEEDSVSRILSSDDEAVITAFEELSHKRPSLWRLLLGGDAGPQTTALVMQLASAAPLTANDQPPEVIVIDGGFSGPSLLQACQ
ncbi:MAG: hypothetical protein CSA82_03250 [Actinobacteria bacterium]|nr:MAG: hypothetical protein CSA82_03250 [Actinomycetota bacterium]